MIKGILFDYGGVIADDGRGLHPMARLAQVLDLSDAVVSDHILPLWHKLIRGQITTDEFWDALADCTQGPITKEERQAWKQSLSTVPFPEIPPAIDSLRAAGYQIGLLSNTTPEARDDIRAAGAYDLFDFTVLSCDVHLSKPQVEIFQLAINEFKQLQPDEIVFVDDIAANIPPAQILGLQTILAESTAQVLADLRNLGLPV